MRKVTVILILLLAITLQYCATTQPAAVKPTVSKITYVSSIQPLLAKHCSPCHFPPEGNKEPLNTYATAKNGIDDILDRIQRNPGEKGFMPAKHARLPDSIIRVFVRWEIEGAVER
ncbi:MAG: hypothetical protein H7Y07_11495 [Pyrinomonadaceae bacterium]|nr:hypothetical protein [Sphingobacteriaceae bacterium]